MTDANLEESYVDVVTTTTDVPRQLKQAYFDALWIPALNPCEVRQAYVEVITPSYMHSTHVYDSDGTIRPVYLMTAGGLVAYDFAGMV